MFLIDTDVLSALRRQERFPEIVRWMSAQRAADLYLSVVSIGEIERGVILQQRSNPDFARTLSLWLDSVIALYGEHILAVNLAIARRWGQLSAKIGNESADLLVAATALEHGLSLVTRNVRHFEPTGVAVIDPSAPTSPGPQ